jgi:hypothetical protein
MDPWAASDGSPRQAVLQRGCCPPSRRCGGHVPPCHLFGDKAALSAAQDDHDGVLFLAAAKVPLLDCQNLVGSTQGCGRVGQKSIEILGKIIAEAMLRRPVGLNPGNAKILIAHGFGQLLGIDVVTVGHQKDCNDGFQLGIETVQLVRESQKRGLFLVPIEVRKSFNDVAPPLPRQHGVQLGLIKVELAAP